MRRIYTVGWLLALLILSRAAWATHIVGGEFELTLTDRVLGTYQLTLNLYFDEINGNPQAEDANITATVFRKRDNSPVLTLTLPRLGNESVNYTNPTCTNARVKTRLIRYGAPLSLSKEFFTDAEGYYVVWERCCRNGTITNIQRPGDVGNTFYLEFPAVIRNGTALLNSSPKFGKPVGDYICLNEPFAFNFGATDPDGDQLRYSLVTPYRGYSSPSAPSPANTGSSNYPPVTWTAGITLNNVIPGPRPLRINPATGQLTVTANQTGLYVFSVLCEEYRDNVKIGAVRRDFQLMALDCPRNAAPGVNMREVGKTGFYSSRETLIIEPDGERCFNLLMTDSDPQTQLTLSLRPLNFENKNFVTLTPSSGLIRGRGDTLRTQLCWNTCAESTNNEPLIFEIIARDQGCPAPQTDTLLVKILFKPRLNRKPTVETNLPLNTATLRDTSQLRFNVSANDADRDNITLEAVGRGFNLAAVGMRFTNGSAVGSLTTPFEWKPTCAATSQRTYVVDFIVRDQRCDVNQSSITTVTLNYALDSNIPPTVRTTLPGNAGEFYIGLNPNPADSLSPIALGQAIVFDVIAEDADRDLITLKAQGRGFNLADLGMRFEEKSGLGRVISPFAWDPDCGTLQGREEGTYVIDFITEDNTCGNDRFDTVTVSLLIRDQPADYVFEPSNVFTPNGDRWNNAFTIPNLPSDNCQERFESIEIYNRWGKLAFQSNRRDFRWEGGNYPTGDYFYLIRYTRRRYKGHVSLLE
ncbi:MAG: gliding motility-associated C-terminal domain-containing protein [Ferruginibacter sp.]|nr:gliding motility-associated C-terminal domain-containing protein [Cytophagales bacterium]